LKTSGFLCVTPFRTIEFVSRILRILRQYQRYCNNSKYLAKEHTNPSLLNRPDGRGTMSAKESLEILADTHFPGNTTSNSEPPAVNTICNCITNYRESLLWAISTFETYKSPGAVEIIPKMLQTIEEETAEWLVEIFKACIERNYVPATWREAKIIFITKPGRRGHVPAKDYSLISFSGTNFGVEGYNSIWIATMLKSRKITSNLCVDNLTQRHTLGKSTDPATLAYKHE